MHARSIKEEGNLFYSILQDNEDPNTLIIYEGYDNEEALDEHRNSKYYVELVTGTIRPLLAERAVRLLTPLVV